MKRSKKEKQPQPIQVWTLTQARAARPYILTLVRSLREHSLELISRRRDASKIAERPGRPDRQTLIALQEAEAETLRAEDRVHEDAAEMASLDVYSYDPVRGQALIPFVHDDQLAWYIFDLFDADPFRFWRFQTDPDETRRPVTARQRGEG
jgi:hypothetical protein